MIWQSGQRALRVDCRINNSCFLLFCFIFYFLLLKQYSVSVFFFGGGAWLVLNNHRKMDRFFNTDFILPFQFLSYFCLFCLTWETWTYLFYPVVYFSIHLLWISCLYVNVANCFSKDLFISPNNLFPQIFPQIRMLRAPQINGNIYVLCNLGISMVSLNIFYATFPFFPRMFSEKRCMNFK